MVFNNAYNNPFFVSSELILFEKCLCGATVKMIRDLKGNTPQKHEALAIIW